VEAKLMLPLLNSLTETAETIRQIIAVSPTEEKELRKKLAAGQVDAVIRKRNEILWKFNQLVRRRERRREKLNEYRP
jgi:hypothetical protein